MLLHLPPMEGHGMAPREKNGPALDGHGAQAVRDAINGSCGPRNPQAEANVYRDSRESLKLMRAGSCPSSG